MSEPPISRRRWLTIRALMSGVDQATAIEAVASVALAHPEWDMAEEMTWTQWQDSRTNP